MGYRHHVPKSSVFYVFAFLHLNNYAFARNGSRSRPAGGFYFDAFIFNICSKKPAE
jgi:hypothetical protein